MSDHDEDDDNPNDLELFNIAQVKVNYSRTKNLKRVTAVISDAAEISEMRLYLILDTECRKLERRLGISDEDPTKEH